MKIGVSSYSFSKYCKATGAGLSDVCKLAKELGFDAIEFASQPGGEDPIAAAKELRALCESLDLPISSYVTGAHFLRDGAGAVERLKGQIDIAEALGATVFRHDIESELPEGLKWWEAVPKIAPYIREVAEYAAQKGIRTCSENHGYIFQDSERVETLIRMVDHTNYRWLVDVGNFLCADEYPPDAVRRAVPYAVHAHIKDFLYRKPTSDRQSPEGFFFTRNGNLLRGTVIGHGDVPVEECVDILLRGGYRGMFVIEFEGAEENIPALKLGLAYLRRVFAAREGN